MEHQAPPQKPAEARFGLKASQQMAQAQTLAFLGQHVEPNTAPLCETQLQDDKRFLEKQMPDIVDFSRYRMIDVSTVKELARRWYADVPRYEKKGAHLAWDDIRESVEELRRPGERVFDDPHIASRHVGAPDARPASAAMMAAATATAISSGVSAPC